MQEARELRVAVEYVGPVFGERERQTVHPLTLPVVVLALVLRRSTFSAANVGDGDGWNEYGGGNVKLPANAIYLPTLTSSIGLRVRLRGDSAAHLGEITTTVHCDERL